METKRDTGLEYFLLDYKVKRGRSFCSPDFEPLRFVWLQSTPELKLEMEFKFGPKLTRNQYEQPHKYKNGEN
ncbi:hypothetical protein D1BOALGB6SA_9325 [Olavius sp. associated proteobacterium Delta 1]|nr:hypothetical protein D1BOALGB6SA_9325 [Olavius sp. associated proteobacterium Delta 1]